LLLIIWRVVQKVKLLKLVDQTHNAKQTNLKAESSALEKQIDELVYQLYELTPEEIAIVEGN